MSGVGWRLREHHDASFLGEGLPPRRTAAHLAEGRCPFLAPYPGATTPGLFHLATPAQVQKEGESPFRVVALPEIQFPSGQQIPKHPLCLGESPAHPRPTVSLLPSHSRATKKRIHMHTLTYVLSPMTPQAAHRSPSQIHKHSAKPGLPSGVRPPIPDPPSPLPDCPSLSLSPPHFPILDTPPPIGLSSPALSQVEAVVI